MEGYWARRPAPLFNPAEKFNGRPATFPGPKCAPPKNEGGVSGIVCFTRTWREVVLFKCYKISANALF